MTNSDLKFLGENIVNGISSFLVFVTRKAGNGFLGLADMKEQTYLGYTIFSSIAFSLLILAFFTVLMYAKYNQ
jgi:hypothetical protein